VIYDCFPFFNELDVLEVRLVELWDVVDRFVLVEGTRTFSNAPKTLHYAENRRRFKRWWSKIHHLICPDMPTHGDSWGRERHQRNFIGWGLIGCEADDAVVITDGDEVVSAEALSSAVVPRRGRVHQFVLQHSFFYFNALSDEDTASISKLMSYQTMIDLGGPEAAARTVHDFIPQGGWHFSYCGGVQKVIDKLGAYSHQDFNRPPFNDPDVIAARRRDLTDVLDRGCRLRVGPPEFLPRHIRQNPGRFAAYLRE
jgi:hypothetical protein